MTLPTKRGYAYAAYNNTIEITFEYPNRARMLAFTWDGDGCPLLRAYADSWIALAQATDLLQGLAALDGQDSTPETLCRLLAALGFEEWEYIPVAMAEGAKG